MNVVKGLVKLLAIGIFVTLQLVEIEMLSNSVLSYRESHILLMPLIVFLILYRSKLTDLILLLVCVYGIYDFFDSVNKSYVTSMDITGNLRGLPFYESLGRISRRILKIYPLLFYLGTLIALITASYRGRLRAIPLNLVLIFCCLIIAGCQSKPTTLTFPEQDEIFKIWLRDTLDVIKKQPDKIGEGLVKSEFKTGEDSLLFDEIKTYEFSAIEGTENNQILNVIALLKKYDEVPRVDYQLSFVVRKSFSPSMVPKLKSEYLFEIQDIIVRTAESTSEYGYIRGRLSGKELSSSKNDSNQTDGTYDFPWQGHKLVKRKK
ncbi:hypothetical protein SAMN05421820_101658 [Pedobacter steynii]|uniref:Uncharacterized protein n=1 Tax=Pedobacter steynii TaxID=430522 RepID=A0A1G9KSA5_9SPHI|nr:hypothetical protein [Pedobacter steynii]NQX38627.1 hypothetical protein [Pedobacter steynii]SDL52367.1 hypothetical protein SAMN05421820_101658 [Pedobacter steynii]